MASCAKNDPIVLLWDLRKLTTQPPANIQSEANSKYCFGGFKAI